MSASKLIDTSGKGGQKDVKDDKIPIRERKTGLGSMIEDLEQIAEIHEEDQEAVSDKASKETDA